MNSQPIENAHDADLRLSTVALQRAALRARELAKKTGTALVICQDNIIELRYPQPETTTLILQESDTKNQKSDS